MRCLILACIHLAGLLSAFGGDLVIVAPREFAPALEEFAAYKRTQLPTTLVPLDEAIAGQGVDDAEKLKRFLFEKWKDGKCAYVLLVGDADVLPVRYMVLDRKTPEAFDYAFYPSDLYYADVAKRDGSFEDWNGRRDGFHAGYFGEVRGEKNKGDPINFDGVDYLPEIAVGRWPVSDVEQVRAVAAKSMKIQQQRAAERGEEAKHPAALIAGTTGWVDVTRHFNRIERMLDRRGKIDRRLFTGPARNPENEAELVELWKRGPDLVLHAGHGQPWEWEQCITTKALPQLRELPNVPVVFSAGCHTACFAALPPYDGYVDVNGVEHIGTDKKQVFNEPPPPPANYQRGKYNKTGFGERLVRMPSGGAVAYIGCNTGSQPCGLTLQRAFVEAVAEKPGVLLGDAWVSAVRAYYQRERLAELKPDAGWYPPTIFFQAMKFMVFGDPTLPM